MGTSAPRLPRKLATVATEGSRLVVAVALTLHPTLQTECLRAEELHQWWLHAYR